MSEQPSSHYSHPENSSSARSCWTCSNCVVMPGRHIPPLRGEESAEWWCGDTGEGWGGSVLFAEVLARDVASDCKDYAKGSPTHLSSPTPP